MTVFRVESLRVIGVALCLSAGSMGLASAQTTSAPAATPSADTLSQIAAFKADPAAWLAQEVAANAPHVPATGQDLDADTGPTTISTTVRNMIDADPSLAQQMVDLAKSAGNLPKANIGVGLAGAAADLVQRNDPNDARAIQQAIALSNDIALLNSFVAGTNEIQTAAIGPGVTFGGIGSTSTPGTPISAATPATPAPGTPNSATPFTLSAPVPSVTTTNFVTTTTTVISPSQ